MYDMYPTGKINIMIGFQKDASTQSKWKSKLVDMGKYL